MALEKTTSSVPGYRYMELGLVQTYCAVKRQVGSKEVINLCLRLEMAEINKRIQVSASLLSLTLVNSTLSCCFLVKKESGSDSSKVKKQPY